VEEPVDAAVGFGRGVVLQCTKWRDNASWVVSGPRYRKPTAEGEEGVWVKKE